MEQLFCRAKQFNQPIDSWEVSQVYSMREMFEDAYEFNQDINSWNISDENDITGIFLRATAFNPAFATGAESEIEKGNDSMELNEDIPF